jgi:hypothetical protein
VPCGSANVPVLGVPPSTAIVSVAPATVGSPTIVSELARSFARMRPRRFEPSVELRKTKSFPMTIWWPACATLEASSKANTT